MNNLHLDILHFMSKCVNFVQFTSERVLKQMEFYRNVLKSSRSQL